MSLELITKNYALTPRELEILHLMFDRVLNDRDIGKKLSISPSTVNNHLANIYAKTKTNGKADIIAKIFSEHVKQEQNWKLFYKPPKILVVDDEPDICETLMEDFVDYGFKVFTTTDPTKVMDLVAKSDLDFIVSDIRMPKINGFELLKMVRTQFKYVPKMIFFSGQSQYNEVQAMEEGAIGFFSKPVDFENLNKAIFEHYIENIHEKDRFLRIQGPYQTILNEKIQLNIQNIGFGGVFIPVEFNEPKLRRDLGVGERVNMEFSLDTYEKPIDVVGEIVWQRATTSDERQSGVGVKFIHIDEECQDVILDFVKVNNILSFIPAGLYNPEA